jgi:hypothetical protein
MSCTSISCGNPRIIYRWKWCQYVCPKRRDSTILRLSSMSQKDGILRSKSVQCYMSITRKGFDLLMHVDWVCAKHSAVLYLHANLKRNLIWILSRLKVHSLTVRGMWTEFKILIYLKDTCKCMYHMGKLPLRKLRIEGRITLEVIFSVLEDEGSRFLQRKKPMNL